MTTKWTNAWSLRSDNDELNNVDQYVHIEYRSSYFVLFNGHPMLKAKLCLPFPFYVSKTFKIYTITILSGTRFHAFNHKIFSFTLHICFRPWYQNEARRKLFLETRITRGCSIIGQQYCWFIDLRHVIQHSCSCAFEREI